MPKPTPELRRARLAASATKGLTVKPGAGARLLWYWEPNRAEKAAGWTTLRFGEDRKAAQSGSDTRNAEIAAWRRGDDADGETTHPVAPVRPVAKPTALMTIAEHADRYETQYVAHLSVGHRRNVKSNLKVARAMFGDFLPADIQPHHIARWTDAMRGRGEYTAQGRQVGDVTAHNRLRSFKALLAWIADPHEKFAQPKGRHQIWEAADRAAFRAAAYDRGYPGMAYALKLAFYSSQRTQNQIAFTEADLTEMKYRLDPADRALLAADDGKVWGWEFVQDKSMAGDSPVHMHIPFEPDMLAETRRIVAANRARDRALTPPRLLTYVLVDDRTGEPWTYRRFNRVWNEIKDHAVACTGRTQMDELHWHDLRRSRVVELKRQGFSHDRIATLTGHEPETIDAIMRVYGPVDPAMTAALIVDSQQHGRQGGRG